MLKLYISEINSLFKKKTKGQSLTYKNNIMENISNFMKQVLYLNINTYICLSYFFLTSKSHYFYYA